jgi:hypothetical protein
MFKKSVLLSGVLFFAATSFISAQENIQNILPNGDLEKTDANGTFEKWQYRGNTTSGVKYSVDKECKHSGNQSVKISFDENRKAADEGYIILRDLKKKVFKAGKKYKWSGYFKTKDFKGAISLIYFYVDKDAKETSGGSTKFNITEDEDWTKFELDFTVPADQSIDLYTHCSSAGGGVIWFDNMTAVEITDK